MGIVYRESKSRRGGLPIEMILTDGSRLIEPRLVSSDPYFDYSHLFRSLLKMPAMGIEFYENGKPLCALQYYGGAKYRPKRIVINHMVVAYGCIRDWMQIQNLYLQQPCQRY